MPNLLITPNPIQVSQSITESATLQNTGLATIYFGNDSAVTPYAPSLILTSGASAQWPANNTLWACVDADATGSLAVLYGAEGTTVGTVTIDDVKVSGGSLKSENGFEYLGTCTTAGSSVNWANRPTNGFGRFASIICALRQVTGSSVANPRVYIQPEWAVQVQSPPSLTFFSGGEGWRWDATSAFGAGTQIFSVKSNNFDFSIIADGANTSAVWDVFGSYQSLPDSQSFGYQTGTGFATVPLSAATGGSVVPIPSRPGLITLQAASAIPAGSQIRLTTRGATGLGNGGVALGSLVAGTPAYTPVTFTAPNEALCFNGIGTGTGNVIVFYNQ